MAELRLASVSNGDIVESLPTPATLGSQRLPIAVVYSVPRVVLTYGPGIFKRRIVAELTHDTSLRNTPPDQLVVRF